MDYPGVALIDFKVQTIIGTVVCPFRILLEHVALAYPTECTYEPELYPALVYHHPTLSVTILVFATGKLVLKAKLIADLNKCWKEFYPLIDRFQDTKPLLSE